MRKGQNHWGWGFQEQRPPRDEIEAVGRLAAERLGFEPLPVEDPVPLESIDLPAPRIQPPSALAGLCSSDPPDRAGHAYGKAYRDIVRAFRGRYDNPPDVVAWPRSDDDVAALLEWCADANLAAIPFGGGTSVVGGVEPRLEGDYAGAVSIDLTDLDQVLEVDR
ncbi:MAG: FAD-binding protein, partial [Solirubrobacteraceae bacterium]